MFMNGWEVFWFIWAASLTVCMTVFFVMLQGGKEYIAESEVSRDGHGLLNNMIKGFVFGSICPIINTVMVFGLLLDFESQKEKVYERIDEAWGIVEEF